MRASGALCAPGLHISLPAPSQATRSRPCYAVVVWSPPGLTAPYPLATTHYTTQYLQPTVEVHRVTDSRIRERPFGGRVTGMVWEALNPDDQQILDESTPCRDFGGTEALR
jgi:hypothetical protein